MLLEPVDRRLRQRLLGRAKSGWSRLSVRDRLRLSSLDHAPIWRRRVQQVGRKLRSARLPYAGARDARAGRTNKQAPSLQSLPRRFPAYLAAATVEPRASGAVVVPAPRWKPNRERHASVKKTTPTMKARIVKAGRPGCLVSERNTGGMVRAIAAPPIRGTPLRANTPAQRACARRQRSRSRTTAVQ